MTGTRRILLTGGAGFIGSHLATELAHRAEHLLIVDNLSSGKLEFIEELLERDNVDFVQDDLLTSSSLNSYMKGRDLVYHLAANPDVRAGETDPHVHLEQNVLVTERVLASMREMGCGRIAFTSTSTVYGEATVIPTPEDYGPLIPISLYGASKLAAEALISSYCHTFGMDAVIYRFANVVGSRGTHGVIFDFVNKLKDNPRKLDILGDGRQTKSYFWVEDCVDAMEHALESSSDRVSIFNVGSEDAVDVRTIADIVVSELELRDVSYSFTGGIDGGRGWKGDVKMMGLSIDRIKATGWSPEHNSAEAVRRTARWFAAV